MLTQRKRSVSTKSSIDFTEANPHAVAILPQEAGTALEKRLIAGEEIWASFPDESPADNWAEGIQTPRASVFSSWGLGNEGSLKPDIAAPGGQILSTYPQAISDYYIASGTSMATVSLAPYREKSKPSTPH